MDATVAADWIRRFHPGEGPSARIVCLPHAGGSATFYFPMSRRLAPEIEALSVQYPGRQDRRNEPCVPTISGMAEGVYSALTALGALGAGQPPLAVFGHSMGALVGYELAALIEDSGAEVAALFVSGRRAPSVGIVETVHRRTDEGVLQELRELDGTAGGLLGDEELLRWILPAVRNDYRAVETYEAPDRAPLRTPIHAYAGEADPRVAVDDVRPWAEHTGGGFTLNVMSGGHFFLVDHAPRILDEIAGLLVPAGAR